VTASAGPSADEVSGARSDRRHHSPRVAQAPGVIDDDFPVVYPVSYRMVSQAEPNKRLRRFN
jgi:hypothetical protein